MQAGKLRHRIEIQQETAKRGEFTSSESWTTIMNASAEIEPWKGDESDNAPLVDGEVTHRIRMRYQPGVKPSHRVKFGTRLFNIRSALNVGERSAELHLMCIEVIV